MIKKILNPPVGPISKEEALKVLKIESRVTPIGDWPIVLFFIVAGFGAFRIGTHGVCLFIGLYAVIVQVYHRQELRRAQVANAVLAILDDDEEE